MIKIRKLVVLCLVVVMVIGTAGISFADFGYEAKFTSQGASDWALSDIISADYEGLLTERTSVKLNENITREEFAGILMRLYEKYEEAPLGVSLVEFKDTLNLDVMTAATVGLINGTGNGNFDPDGFLTREQLATMFERLMVQTEISVPVTMEYRTYKDSDQISDWASNAVQTLNKLGVIQGVAEGVINPKGTATKEQAIVMTVRLMNILDEHVE